MARILCTGVATLDIINEIATYPEEDDEIRVLAQKKRRGGNATNTAIVLSQLGHQCDWAGTMVDNTVDKSDCLAILADLDHYQINYSHCTFLPQGKVPTSYITLSRDTGSRTICHYRDLPEYTFQAFKRINLQQFDWLHFEGRNIEQTQQMIAYSKQLYPETPISVEIEKNRDNVERLIQYANVILFSRHYILSRGFTDARQFCQQKNAQYPDKTIICAWGASGAGASFEQNYYWQDAEKVNTINTIGAGDVFNAGIIDQLSKHKSIKDSLAHAVQLASLKCTQKGFKLGKTCKTT